MEKTNNNNEYSERLTSMNEIKAHFDPEFAGAVDLVATKILENPEVDEMEVPGFPGQFLTLTSRDGVTNTLAFEDRLKGDQLNTGPLEYGDKDFCLFT